MKKMIVGILGLVAGLFSQGAFAVHMDRTMFPVCIGGYHDVEVVVTTAVDCQASSGLEMTFTPGIFGWGSGYGLIAKNGKNVHDGKSIGYSHSGNVVQIKDFWDHADWQAKKVESARWYSEIKMKGLDLYTLKSSAKTMLSYRVTGYSVTHTPWCNKTIAKGCRFALGSSVKSVPMICTPRTQTVTRSVCKKWFNPRF